MDSIRGISVPVSTISIAFIELSPFGEQQFVVSARPVKRLLKVRLWRLAFRYGERGKVHRCLPSWSSQMKVRRDVVVCVHADFRVAEPFDLRHRTTAPQLRT